MHELGIFSRAERHGDAIAMECEGESISYRELVAGASRVAAGLLGESADLAEARVAILAEPGPEYVKCLLGVWLAGGVATPLSLSATEKELTYVLQDAQVSQVVATATLVARVGPMREALGLRVLNLGEAQAPVDRELPAVSRDRRAMILYTSGTTSRPKGVVTMYDGLEAQITSLIEAWRWRSDDSIPLFLPLHHVHGIVNVLLCGLWSGARVEAFPRFDADRVMQRVADDAYSVFMAVPTIYVKLIQKLKEMPAARHDSIVAGFGRMRLMVSGSAALPASVHAEWSELTGQVLLERYGMTEIGMAISNPYEGERRPGAVGLALPGVDIRLVAENGELIDAEEAPGEIQVRGRTVFREYWDRGEATSEAFQDGWFRTGDVAVLEGGYYRILGRSSVDIIKSGGYKLSALEIEASLLDHSGIEECAVVGLDDATWGELVAAAVVPADGRQLSSEELRDWCSQAMSPYKVPRRFLFAEALPRNAMGKVTKPAVRELFSVD